MKKYTFKEISKAWYKFTSPTYLVDKTNTIDIKDLKPGGIIEYDKGITELKIDYSRWLSYLTSELWKKN